MTKIFTVGATICLAGLALVSCEEKGLLVNSNDVSYLRFTKNMTKDTTTVSFKMYNEGEDALIPVEVTVYGRMLEEDLHFNVDIDESRTTLGSDLYELPGDCVINKGELTGTITVKLKNSPELRTSTKKLAVRFVEADGVKQGDWAYSRAMITVTDRLFKPDWWSVNDAGTDADPGNSVDWFYLGEYSETKYQMFLDELKKDGVIFDGKNKQVLRLYSLRLKNTLQRLKDAGTPAIDEFGEEITVVVAG